MGGHQVTRILENFDAITDQELPIEAAKLEERVAEYSENAWVPIRFNGTRIPRENTTTTNWFFDGAAIRVALNPVKWYQGNVQLLYRGAEVKSPITGGPYFSAVVDILSGNAEQILTLSREELRASTRNNTIDQVSEAIEKAILDHLENLRVQQADPAEIAQASLAVLCATSSTIRARSGDEWKNLKIGSSDLSFNTLFESRSFLLTTHRQRSGTNADLVVSTADSGLELLVESHSLEQILRVALDAAGFRHQKILQVGLNSSRPEEDRPEIRRISVERFDDVVDSDEVFRDVIRTSLSATHVGSRRTLPCRSRFAALELGQDTPQRYMVRVKHDVRPRMLSPFLVLHDHTVVIKSLKELVAFVLRHAVTKDRDAIIAMYGEFIVSTDELMQDDPQWQKAKSYRTPAATEELTMIAAEGK